MSQRVWWHGLLGADYRGEESILAIGTLEQNGWGLVLKIGRAEALEPALARRSIALGTARTAAA